LPEDNAYLIDEFSIPACSNFGAQLTLAWSCYCPFARKKLAVKRRTRRSVGIGATCLLALLSIAAQNQKSNAPQPKNVLILYSFTARDALGDFGVVETTIRSRVSGPVNFQVEYLDALRFDTPGYEQGLAATLAATYREQKIDLVMTAFYPALAFAVKHREQIFPGTPIVFFSVMPKRFEGQKMWPNVTGVMYDGDMKGALDLARRLQPETENVAVIAGGSAFERFLVSVGEDDLRKREPRLKAIDLVGLPADQLLTKVNALPPHTVAYFLMVPQDSAQPVLGIYNLLAAIAAKVPTYCVQRYCMGSGAIGGNYADFSEQGVDAGEIAARVLAGERPENIPISSGGAARLHVDLRQLKRWKIPESAIPAGTVIVNPEPGLWQRIRLSIREWTLLAVLVAAMVVLVSTFRRYSSQMRRFLAHLREGEERFRLLTDAMPLLIWMSDEGGRIYQFNQAAVNFIGLQPEADVMAGWMAHIHPEDLRGAMREFEYASENHTRVSAEFRLRRADGEYRWVLGMAAPRFNPDGSFAGMIGYASDVTDQKKAQEALRNVGGRMIEAQEKERSRIARELHDDICQKLALLSMELEMSKRMVLRPGGPVEIRMEEMRQHCSSIAADVQALSHELHSSRLDYLGLTVALQSFCQEFSQQQNVNVEFQYEDVPDSLPNEVSLSVFRIAQEGLHNSLKYSGVDRFSLHLWGTGDTVQLEICDFGSGFEVDQARAGKGLGLISMQERAHLVNGSFAIESAPGDGTRILVCVPLAGEAVEWEAGGDGGPFEHEVKLPVGEKVAR
jgi:PAS domain S-box-containing protein